MSIKKRARRIDLDTEEHIYHLKVTPAGSVNTVITTTSINTLMNQKKVIAGIRSNFQPPQVKSQDIFDAWVSKLRHHRLYRQNEIVRSPREATMRTFPPPAAMESPQPAPSAVRDLKVTPSILLDLATPHNGLFR